MSFIPMKLSGVNTSAMILYDDFNRADSATVGNTIKPGTAWTETTGGDAANNCRIESNTLILDATGGIPNPNWAQVTMTLASAISSGTYTFECRMKYTDPGFDWRRPCFYFIGTNGHFYCNSVNTNGTWRWYDYVNSANSGVQKDLRNTYGVVKVTLDRTNSKVWCYIDGTAYISNQTTKDVNVTGIGIITDLQGSQGNIAVTVDWIRGYAGTSVPMSPPSILWSGVKGGFI